MSEVVETIARAMCEAQQYACTENELARALDEVPGFLADLQRAGLAIVPCEPSDAMWDAAMREGYDQDPATYYRAMISTGKAKA